MKVAAQTKQVKLVLFRFNLKDPNRAYAILLARAFRLLLHCLMMLTV